MGAASVVGRMEVVARVRLAHLHDRVSAAHGGISAAAVHMQVYKARRKVLPAAVEHLGALGTGDVRADLCDLAVFDEEFAGKHVVFPNDLNIFYMQHHNRKCSFRYVSFAVIQRISPLSVISAIP